MQAGCKHRDSRKAYPMLRDEMNQIMPRLRCMDHKKPFWALLRFTTAPKLPIPKGEP